MLVVGEAYEDWIFAGLGGWPGPGQEFKTDQLHRTAGGGALITAVAAARQGMPVTLLSALGPDQDTLVRSEGVDVTNLMRSGDAPAMTVVLATPENRSFLTYNGVNSQLESRLYEALSSRTNWETGQHVHCAFEPKQPQLWSSFFTGQREAGITVSWDFGWSEALPKRDGFADLLQSLDIVFLNQDEAVLYSCTPNLSHALTWWSDLDRCVVVRQGAQGACWLSGSERHTAPSPKVTVADTTGAGDAFNAGFLFAWLQKLSPLECLQVGNRLGAQSVTAIGGLAGLSDLRVIKSS